MAESPAYRFKHSNATLEDYLESMRFRANQKRAEARMLEREAQIIEDERHRLQGDLEAVEEEESSDG